MKMIVGRKLSSAVGWFPPRSRFRNKSTNWVQVKRFSMRIDSTHRSVMPYQNGKKNNSENTARATIWYTAHCNLEGSFLKQGLKVTKNLETNRLQQIPLKRKHWVVASCSKSREIQWGNFKEAAALMLICSSKKFSLGMGYGKICNQKSNG